MSDPKNFIVEEAKTIYIVTVGDVGSQKDFIPFNSSCKVDIASSLSETDKLSIVVIYHTN
mgnify:CR=1 FL=1